MVVRTCYDNMNGVKLPAQIKRCQERKVLFIVSKSEILTNMFIVMHVPIFYSLLINFYSVHLLTWVSGSGLNVVCLLFFNRNSINESVLTAIIYMMFELASPVNRLKRVRECRRTFL